MADRNYTRDRQDVHLEDVVEVGSRVSWGAIIAGAVMALAVCFVLNLLGQALGISLSDRASRDTLGMGAAIWAVITSMVGLFIGGWVTSQCVVGETKTESVVHGIIMWGVSLAFMLWGTASGINPNFTGMMKVANMAGVVTEPGEQQTSRATTAGAIPQEQTPRVVQSNENNANNTAANNVAANNAPANNAPANNAPANNVASNSASNATPHQRGTNYNDTNRRAGAYNDTDRVATRATWWTLANTVLSIVSAVVGSFLGAGPTFRLIPLHVTHRQFSNRGAIPGGA